MDKFAYVDSVPRVAYTTTKYKMVEKTRKKEKKKSMNPKNSVCSHARD